MKDFPPIFISHSAAPNDDQDALLSEIKTALADFEILLDQDLLQAGDLWRDELHTWMALCHAAIVILSPGVVANNKWVLKEFTILSWRRSLDRNFILIPVLLPGVTRKDFEGDYFSPLLVGEIQMARGDTAAIVAQLKTQFAKLHQSEPPHVAKLIDNVASGLIKLSRSRCEEAVRALDPGPLPWDARLEPNERLARRMVHADFSKLSEVLIDISPIIGKNAASEILEWLFTFWIDPEAVVSIPAVVYGAPACRGLALNSTDPLTISLYVRRAFCNYPPGWMEVAVNADGGENPVEDVERQLGDFFRRSRPQLMSRPDLVQDYVTDMGTDVNGDPTFVLVDGALPPGDLLTLQNNYPAFTFVLGTGPKLPAEGYYPADRLRLLRPELDSKVERQKQIQLIKVLSRIGN